MVGLLILTLSYRQLSKLLPQVVGSACSHVTKVLYVQYDPAAVGGGASVTDPRHVLLPAEASSLIQAVYTHASSLCRSLDVRVVLPGFKGHALIPRDTNYAIEKIMIDRCGKGGIECVMNKYESLLNGKEPVVILGEDNNFENEKEEKMVEETEVKIYKDIVAGGTFDRIHMGHKILLSEGILRCTRKFTIGIADGPLLVKKTLYEMIEPVDVRIKTLHSLLKDMDPTINYYLEPIHDPLGPSGVDPDMEMIIVSQETLKGGHFVNKVRAERNLSTLDVEVVNLVEDSCRNSYEEGKMSSSSGRMRLLGTLLKSPEFKPDIAKRPYVIGLSGGSASGKSSIAKTLESFGAEIIDCDKLGHQAYTKGTPCYHKLIATYGEELLTSEGEIDRKVLGARVFGDAEQLKTLNSIVWPEILQLVKERLQTVKAAVAVIDAAVLLEAGWDKHCHEVWVCVLPEGEAVQRIVARDGCSEEAARLRLARQLSNSERVAVANTVLCTLWDHRYTHTQLEVAWARLKRDVIKGNITGISSVL